MNKEIDKKSKLLFDMKIVRKLLKMNGEIKFCPYCGAKIDDGCECHKNFVIDIKPYRNENGEIEANRSVMVFHNNKSFQADHAQLVEALMPKKDIDDEPECLTMDLD